MPQRTSLTIIHLADIHIRNYQYHEQYKKAFNDLYDKAQLEQPDYICIVGDIAHTKTDISPEYVELASSLFKNLADIAPLIITLGNHDLNLKNPHRQDAVSPIVRALNHPNIFLLKESCILKRDNVHFYNLSIVDPENWPTIEDAEAINIALYHGSIYGSQTDLGFNLEHCEEQTSTFKDFDYTLLGDIHKRQALDKEGRIRYPGSTIQQNFSEVRKKGFLSWKIRNKKEFSIDFIEVHNPKPFVTIDYNDDIESVDCPLGSRVRLIAEGISQEDISKKLALIKDKFKPDSVVCNNRSRDLKIKGKIDVDSLSNIDYQNKVLRKYLEKKFDISTEDLEHILQLNKHYNSRLDLNQAKAKNWTIENIEWSNLFNYGQNNTLDLSELSGVVGIFGGNWCGKSSAVDSILWTLFNSISRNSKKTVHLINNKYDEAKSKAKLRIGDELIEIERKATKYKKGKKHDARTELNAINLTSGQSLNGLDRNESDNNIRDLIGTIDDFLLTSMSSQFENMQFVNEGSTKRKEILSRFLGLNVFEKIYKIVNDEKKDFKARLKKFEEINYDEELATNRLRIDILNKDIEILQIKLNELDSQITEAQSILSSIILPQVEDFDESLDGLKSEKHKIESAISILREEKIDLQTSCEQILKEIYNIESDINSINIDDLNEKKSLLMSAKIKISELTGKLGTLNNQKRNSEEQTKLLTQVPCQNSFPDCKFLKRANEEKVNYPMLLENIKILEDEINSLVSLTNDELTSTIDRQMADHRNKQTTLTRLRSELSVKENKLRIKEKTIDKNNLELQTIDNRIDKFISNKKSIEKAKELFLKKKDIENVLSDLYNQKKTSQGLLIQYAGEKGKLEQKISDLTNEQNRYELLRKQYSLYEVYTKAISPKGLPYFMLVETLPQINSEVNKILGNIKHFDVVFENEDNRLEISIQKPGYDARPIELASGAEKTLASIAIRLALINISSLPKSDIFILDEPAVALDSDKLQDFQSTLEIIKNNFRVVLLITHITSLKDSVDHIIDIGNINGDAKI